jgi:hypothetical protein
VLGVIGAIVISMKVATTRAVSVQEVVVKPAEAD